MPIPPAPCARLLLATLLAGALAGCTAFAPPPAPAPPPWEQGPLEETPSAWTATLLGVADGLEERGDLAGALAAVEKALVQSPRDRSALVRRADLLLALDARGATPSRTDEARALLGAAARPDDPASEVALARLAWLDGDTDVAADRLRRAAALAPRAAAPERLLAELEHARGNLPAALAAADRAVERQPGSAAALRTRARLLLGWADPVAAADDARLAARTGGGDEAQLLLGRALLAAGRAAEALRALESVPQPRRSAELAVALGIAQSRRGIDPRPVLEAGVQRRPDDADALALLLALDRADGQVADSLARIETALAARPDDAALHRLHAIALLDSGRADDAEAAALRALGSDPADLESYGVLASVLRVRDRERAEARAATTDLAPAARAHLVGTLREMRGDGAGALAAWSEASAADATFAPSRVALALDHAEEGRDLDAALARAREAFALRPGDPFTSAALGSVWLARGNAPEAVPWLRRAVGAWPEYHPALPEARAWLARALERTGEGAAARAAARAALEAGGAQASATAWAKAMRALVQ